MYFLSSKFTPKLFLLATKLFLITLISCFLLACQIKKPVPQSKPVVEDLGLHNISQQDKAIALAISKLEIGQVKQAEKIIDEVLEFNNSHKTANLLKKQLTQSFEKLFKTKRTIKYQIKSGDSLGNIAKQWLGNSLYFVSLAKLNKIKNPTKIQPQSLIKIPVLSSSPLVKREKRRSNANLALLKKYVDEKRFIKSLQRMTSIYIAKSHHKKLLNLQQNTLEQMALSQVSITERYKMIEQLKSITKNSKRKFLNPNFNLFIQQQNHAVLLDEFSLLFDAGSYKSSAEKFIQAKKLDSKHDSLKKYSSKRDLLIQKLHEQAILLRKNQKLQQAVDSWALILEIQPENELALKYYERTRKLLDRLNQL